MSDMKTETQSDHQKDGKISKPTGATDLGESDTAGGMPQADVEDRPNVSTVKPEDYPKDQQGGAS